MRPGSSCIIFGCECFEPTRYCSASTVADAVVTVAVPIERVADCTAAANSSATQVSGKSCNLLYFLLSVIALASDCRTDTCCLLGADQCVQRGFGGFTEH